MVELDQSVPEFDLSSLVKRCRTISLCFLSLIVVTRANIQSFCHTWCAKQMHGSRKYMQREDVHQPVGTVPATRAQQQQGPSCDLSLFPLWHSPTPNFGKVAAPSWLVHCSPIVCSCVCVCVCFPAGVCHVWTVPSAATGASTVTCVPMTPPAAPSRRDESTPLRFAGTPRHPHTILTCPILFLLYLALSCTHSPSFLLASCCSSMSTAGHVFRKTAFKSPLFSKCCIFFKDLVLSSSN